MESKTDENQNVVVDTPAKSWDTAIKEQYESFWLYPENHPSRLAQHIILRGVAMGSTFGFLGAIPYAFMKRKGQIVSTVTRSTLRGTVIGGSIMGLVAAQRWYTLDPIGITDRAYRISYNWGQTKWDYFNYEGAALGMLLLRRPLGGIFAAGAVGIAVGSLTYFTYVILTSSSKKTAQVA